MSTSDENDVDAQEIPQGQLSEVAGGASFNKAPNGHRTGGSIRPTPVTPAPGNQKTDAPYKHDGSIRR